MAADALGWIRTLHIRDALIHVPNAMRSFISYALSRMPQTAFGH